MFPELGGPDLIAVLVDMQAVRAELGAHAVASLSGEEREEVDILYFPLRSDLSEAGVERRHSVRPAREELVAAEALVDGQQALQDEARGGRLAADAVDGRGDGGGYLGARQAVRDVVNARHEHDGPGMEGQDLMEALTDARHIVAYNAAIDHTTLAEALAPVAAVLREAVAEHHDALLVDVLRAGEGVHAVEVVGRKLCARHGARHRVHHERAEAYGIAAAGHMDCVGEEDDGHPLLRVDVDHGAGKARVTVSRAAEHIAEIGGVGRAHVPARRAAELLQPARQGRHEAHGGGTEDSHTAELSAADERLAEQGYVVRRGEHARVAADTAVQDPGQRIVHLPPEHLPGLLLLCGSHILHPFVLIVPLGPYGAGDVYLLKLTGEEQQLRNLPEIRMAQDAMADNIFRHLSFEPEDSQFIEDYYLALFTNIEEQKKSEYLFQYRDGKTYALAGLLSGNLKAGDKTYKLHQPFKTAAQEYKVFPENTYPVLVPYKEDGKKLIESMRAIDRAGRIISKTLLRQAGDYIVQVYDWQKRKLGEKSMLESLADDQIFILSEVAYDERYGLNTDAEWTMEDMIY